MNCNKEVILLHQAFCDYCSTIEGEPELSRNKHRTIYEPVHPITCTFILYLHTGGVMIDLADGTVPYTEGPMLIQLLQDTTCDTLGT